MLTPMLYLAYALLATAVFSYLLFPGQRMKAFILARMNTLVPQLSVTAQDVGIGFPLSLELENITWLVEGNPVMTSNRLTIKPGIISLVQKKNRVRH